MIHCAIGNIPISALFLCSWLSFFADLFLWVNCFSLGMVIGIFCGVTNVSFGVTCSLFGATTVYLGRMHFLWGECCVPGGESCFFQNDNVVNKV